MQRAIWKAEQRAIRYAMNQGVTVVASEGNESEDLSHPTMDTTSPDDPHAGSSGRSRTPASSSRSRSPASSGSPRPAACVQGTAAGQYADNLKSYYSSFGMSTADVAAPGGDFYFRGTDPGARRSTG